MGFLWNLFVGAFWIGVILSGLGLGAKWSNETRIADKLFQRGLSILVGSTVALILLSL